jgi:hypothetical protein
MADSGRVIQMVEKCSGAWEPMHEIEIYGPLQNDPIRFKMVPAGRRSGKTEKFKRYLVIRALYESNKNFFIGAPTVTRVKTLYWNDLMAKIPPGFVRKTTQGAQLIIHLVNGTCIYLLGMDNPKVIEGGDWDGGGIDEWDDIISKHPECWDENIRPALSSRKKQPWIWCLGVPGGLNGYYKMCQDSLSGKWKNSRVYSWHSSLVLSPEEIAEAMATMSPRAFRQEYQANFESVGNRVYEDYSAANHTDFVFSEVLPIIWCHDFNYSPLSSCICQEHNGKIYVVDEIILEGVHPRMAAQEFAARYGKYKNKEIRIYGDVSGHAGQGHAGAISNYQEIRAVLLQAGFTNVQFRIPAENPPLKFRHNAVNAKVNTYSGVRSLLVNPQKCPTVDAGMLTAQFVKGSTELENDSNPTQHVTTGLGYFIAFDAQPQTAGTIKVVR